jgi:hypothetical protein
MRMLRCAARFYHITPGLVSHSLVSVVKLCEAGCKISFTKWGISVEIRYNGRVVLTVSKCTRTGLWMIPLTNTPKTQVPTHVKQEILNSCSLAHTALEQHATSATQTSTKAELAIHHHQALGSPPRSTLLQMIHKHPSQVASFPGLIYDLISKHLPVSEATEKGHMIQTQQNLRSTSSNKQAILDDRQDLKDMDPPQHMCSATGDDIFCVAVLGDRNKDTVYSDLTDRFLVHSFEGMEYIFVAYVYKLNTILLRSMKSRKTPAMVEAFTSVYA